MNNFENAVCDLDGTADVNNVLISCNAAPTHRMAGEQDSFGTEWLYLCDTHFNAVCDEVNAEVARRKVGHCQCCKQHSDDLSPTKRFNENSWEDALFICMTCYRQLVEQEQEELDFLAERDASWNRRYGFEPVEF